MVEIVLVFYYKIKIVFLMNVWVGERILYEMNKVVFDLLKELEI